MRANRTMKARKASRCNLCAGPVTVGQQIGRLGSTWVHSSCAASRIRGDTAGVVTVEEMTVDIADEQLRAIAADSGIPGDLPLPEVRQMLAISRLAQDFWGTGVYTKERAAERAAAMLGLTKKGQPS